MPTPSTWTHRFRITILPSLLLVSHFFLFGPFGVYQGNPEEFDVSLPSILQRNAPYGIGFLLLLPVIIAAFRGKTFTILLSVITAIGIVTWIQGNLLLWDYGQIGRTDIDWSTISWRGWVDGAIWILILASSIIWAPAVTRNSGFVCGALILMRLAILTLGSVQQPSLWQSRPQGPDVAPNEVVQFSRSNNVVHFVLDELQSTVLRDLIETDTALADVFEGFTFFSNNAGVFPTTIMSIPAIISGKRYENQTPVDVFQDSVFSPNSPSLPNELSDAGYAVDIVTPHDWERALQHRSYFQLPVPYGSTPAERATDRSRLMMDLMLFRHAPHFAKQWVMERRIMGKRADTDDGQKSKPTRASFIRERHFSHRAFMKDLVDRMVVTDGDPTYKFIHVLSTHFPMVYNLDGTPTDGMAPYNWESIPVQVRICLEDFANFVRKARDLGIWDKMLVIVNADHGYWKVENSSQQLDLTDWQGREAGDPVKGDEYMAQILSAAMPTLAIKRPGDKGPMKISQAPTSLTDIPATVSQLLSIDKEYSGLSVFSIEEKAQRDRYFAYYEELIGGREDYFRDMTLFRIDGHVSNPNSWSNLGKLRPERDPSEFTRIDFSDPKDRLYLGDGWWRSVETSPANGEQFIWAVGEAAKLMIPLSKSSPSRVRLNIEPYPFPTNQKIDVMVNGKVYSSWELSKRWQRKQVVIPAEANTEGDWTEITLKFAQHKPESTTGDKRLLAARISWITIETINSSAE